MKKLIVSLSFTIALAHLCKAQPSQPPPDFYNDFVSGGFGFWENPSPGWVVASDGEPVNDVQFVSDGALPRAFIRRDTQVSFVLASVDTSVSTPDTLRRLDMSFSGELFLHPDAVAVEELPGHRNFYLPHCGSDGVTDVHAWNCIVYENVYDKIDLWLYCGQRGQKMALVIHPGGNPDDIRLLFDGQNDMDLDVFGNLKLLMEERWIVLPEAVAYQYDSGNGIHPLSWTAEYVPNENTGQVGFTFDTYDTSMPLVLLIGPPPMPQTPPGSGVPPCWSTYVAGNGIDAANANGVDADGNSYVAGLTSTVFAEFPGTAAGTNFSATGTAYFTSKFSPQYELLWTSYYGGDGLYQEPWAMAVKNTMAGPEIYVVGQTSNDDQYTVAPPGAYYDSIPALTAQGCIAKYSELGFLTWATYFGNAQTAIHGAAIDGNNNLVITGTSYGGLPVPDVQPAGSTYFGHGVANDAFVAQFDEDDGLRWSTYLPGSVSDHGKSINALENGLVVCGTTNSPNFHLVDPGGAAYFRDTLQGEEVYVALFNASDSLVWSTFVGGSGADATGFCRSTLEVDATGNIYLIGTTTSPDLPVDPDGGWSNSTPTNGFIVQFLKNSFGMEWMTYVGDSASRVVPTAIISDEDGTFTWWAKHSAIL